MKSTCKAIMLVEDDEVDAMTVRRALKELHVGNPLVQVENGEEALAFALARWTGLQERGGNPRR